MHSSVEASCSRLVILVGGGTMTGASVGGSMMANAWTGHAGMSGFGWTGTILVLVVGLAAPLLLGNRGPDLGADVVYCNRDWLDTASGRRCDTLRLRRASRRGNRL